MRFTSLIQEQCLEIIKKLKKNPLSSEFLKPVEDVYPGIREEYRKIISNPMDISTIQSKLEKRLYLNLNEFINDVNLIWSNCFVFNASNPFYINSATYLKDKFNRWIKKISNNNDLLWLSKIKKIFNKLEIKNLLLSIELKKQI